MIKYTQLILLFLLIFAQSCGGGGGGGGGTSGGDNAARKYELKILNNMSVLGPVENAQATIYRLNAINTSIAMAITGEHGSFQVTLPASINDDELLLIKIQGGKDIDANDDNVLDATPTTVQGAFHALVTKKQIEDGEVFVSIISEIAWQYVNHMIDEVHPDDIKMHLDDLSNILFTTNADASNDFSLLNRFNPLSSASKARLQFIYNDLVGVSSLTGAIHNNASANSFRELIKDKLNQHIVLNKPNDRRAKYAKLKVNALGAGIIAVNNGAIRINPTDATNNQYADFYTKGTTIEITATATDKYKLDSWEGCDIISADKTICTIALNKDEQVQAIFLQDEVKLNAVYNYFDFSDATIDGTNDNYTIRIDATFDRSQIDKLAIGDIIISKKPSNVLIKKVTSVIKNNANTLATIQTETIDPFTLIENASLNYHKSYTHSDLASVDTTSTAFRVQPLNRSPYQTQLQPTQIDNQYFSSRIVPSKKDDRQFTIMLGETDTNTMVAPSLKSGISLTKEIYNKDGSTISVSGSLSVAIDIDKYFDISLFKVKRVRIVPSITFEEDLSLTLSGKLDIKEKRIFLTTVPLARQIFTIGVIPVYFSQNIDFYIEAKATVEGEASISSTHSQKFWAGVDYKNPPFENGEKFIWETGYQFVNNIGEVKAKIQLKAGVYLVAETKVFIYELFGPQIDAKLGVGAQAGLKGSANLDNQKTGFFLNVGFEAKATAKMELKDIDNKLVKKISGLFDRVDVLIFKYDLPFYKESGKVESNPSLLSIAEFNYEDAIQIADVGSLPPVLHSWTLKNIGGANLDWKADMSFDVHQYNISPFKGSLSPDETTTVNLSLDNAASLGEGVHKVQIVFKNKDNADNELIRNAQLTINEGKPAIPSISLTQSDTEVNLNWNVISNASSYELVRSDLNQKYSEKQIGGEITATSYTDDTITLNDEYSYRVRACNKDYCSDYSNTVLTAKPNPSKPSIPSGLSATGGDQQIFLSWNKVDQTIFYEIYRGTQANGSDRTPDPITSPANTLFVDINLPQVQTYYYWFKACNVAGCSDFSSAVSATTSSNPPSIPSIPTGLSATGNSQQIALSWSKVDQAAFYQIYRDESNPTSDRASNPIISPINNSFVDTGLTNGQVYYYWFKACNAAGCSDFSSAVSATPSPIRTSKLNDTGITWGGDYSSGNNATCTSNITADQDCHQGRDASTSLVKIGGGEAGFDFTKLAADGTALGIQNGSWDDNGNENDGTKWSCVKDNYTGLIWEVKNNESASIHYKDHTYRWGGITAIGRNHPNKQGDYYDDWNLLVEGSNTEQLCGFDDWRVPTIDELDSIVHHGKFDPVIDDHYFPNTVSDHFWSSSPDAEESDYAWNWNFGLGNDDHDNRYNSNRVRLVRFGP